MTEERGRRKVRIGRVVSDKMNKTVLVAVERRVHHPLYGKSMRRTKNFAAHDEANAYHIGDVVRIVETRPLSKTKRWRVLDVLHRADLPDVSPDQAAAVAVEELLEPAAEAEPEAAAPEAVSVAEAEPEADAEEKGEEA